ncbi:MAG: hypothetical protein U0744_13970 [Gemmataceae bacterium]
MAAGALAVVLIAWLAASAQERRAPWPPRPVPPPEDGAGISAPPLLNALPPPSPIKQTQYDNSGKELPLPKIVRSQPGAGVIVLPDPDSVLPAGGTPRRPELPPRRLPVETAAPPLNVEPMPPVDVRDDPAKTIEGLLQAIQQRKSAEPPKASATTPTIPDTPPLLDAKPPAIEPRPPVLVPTPPAPMPSVPQITPTPPLTIGEIPPEPKLDPLPPIAPLPPLPKPETTFEPKIEPKAEPKLEPKVDVIDVLRQSNKPAPMPPLPGVSVEPKSPEPAAKIEPKVEVRPEPGRFILVKPVRRNEPGPDLFDPSRTGQDKVAPPPSAELDPDASVTPQLTVEKRGPFAQKLGPALAYQILVRNVGQTPAANIRVEDEIPGSIKLIDCDPRPDSYEGDKAIWKIASLRPGEERVIQLKLQSDRPGEMASTTAVHVFASTSFRTKILPGEKGEKGNTLLDDEGPNLFPPAPKTDVNRTSFDPSRSFSVDAKSVGVKVGATATIEVVVTNRTPAPLEGLQMFAKVPSGLKHPRGNEIFADLPAIKPNDTRTFKVPLSAPVAGSHQVEVRIVGKGGEASTITTVDVGNGGVSSIGVGAGSGTAALSVTQPAVTRLALNRDGEVQIQVTNHQEKNLRNIELLDRLPNNLEFVGASDRGLYQQATRTVHWLIDSLPAGQTRTVSLKVQPKAPGQFPHEVVARAMHLPEQKSAGTVEVEGFASLTLKIRDREDPVEIGKDAVYDIVLENRGSTAATNVRIAVLMDDGMTPRTANGSQAFQVQGRTITFAPIARLAPGSTATLQVMTTASQPGDRRVRVQATSDQQTTPVWREESTTAYRE